MRNSIIVIEDDEAIRESIAEILEWRSFCVLKAANGREGLDQLRACLDPALVLLDLWMPIMTGWQFLEAKLCDDRLAAVPVVVISAMGNPVCLKGACCFLGKPMDLAELFRIVECHRLKA
jgi:CheY-like chemotaxis protein